ncbi:hypothetical protein L1887_62028 [Cichorium endivia]|nr:hypothetical protein L1887_62028 [Cichorium endivia]
MSGNNAAEALKLPRLPPVSVRFFRDLGSVAADGPKWKRKCCRQGWHCVRWPCSCLSSKAQRARSRTAASPKPQAPRPKPQTRKRHAELSCRCFAAATLARSQLPIRETAEKRRGRLLSGVGARVQSPHAFATNGPQDVRHAVAWQEQGGGARGLSVELQTQLKQILNPRTCAVEAKIRALHAQADAAFHRHALPPVDPQPQFIARDTAFQPGTRPVYSSPGEALEVERKLQSGNKRSRYYIDSLSLQL